MVKVLLTVLLFGLSFSGQADEQECDLNVEVEKGHFFSTHENDDKHEALTKAKNKALNDCRSIDHEPQYSHCRIVSSGYSPPTMTDYGRARVEAVGERVIHLTYEERRALLCERINQCIGNGKGSLEQLKVLFKMNRC